MLKNTNSNNRNFFIVPNFSLMYLFYGCASTRQLREDQEIHPPKVLKMTPENLRRNFKCRKNNH